MEQTAALDAAPKTDAECEAPIDQIVVQMKSVREQMANDRRDIVRLQTETDVPLTRLKAR